MYMCLSCFSHFIYHEYLWSTTISTGATLYDIPDRDPHNLLSIPYTSLSGLKTFNARTSGRLKEVTISMHLFTRKCIGQFQNKNIFYDLINVIQELFHIPRTKKYMDIYHDD